VLLAIAWRTDASLADLGLNRKDASAGLLYGAGAFRLVLFALLVAAGMNPCTIFAEAG